MAFLLLDVVFLATIYVRTGRIHLRFGHDGVLMLLSLRTALATTMLVVSAGIGEAPVALVSTLMMAFACWELASNKISLNAHLAHVGALMREIHGSQPPERMLL